MKTQQKTFDQHLENIVRLKEVEEGEEGKKKIRKYLPKYSDRIKLDHVSER